MCVELLLGGVLLAIICLIAFLLTRQVTKVSTLTLSLSLSLSVSRASFLSSSFSVSLVLYLPPLHALTSVHSLNCGGNGRTQHDMKLLVGCNARFTAEVECFCLKDI